MPTFTTRKNKIVLTDYNYRRDIENRLFMAELSILEVDVLQEIINGSLKTTLTTLADNLEIAPSKLRPILDKLAKSGLFQIQGDGVLVDKEMRKYYEAHIIKFDDDFRPDMEYLQGLLSKAPIHALPSWYAIPRSSDNIFNSIIEKFLFTPKIYERYLQDLVFDNPIISSIAKQVFAAPDYKISASALIEKFGLTREQFEEYMLFLEFSLVCCLRYVKTNDVWEEVVTPFHEWHEFLLFVQNTHPVAIQDVTPITAVYEKEFGFLNELNAFVKKLLKKGISFTNAPKDLLEVALLLEIAKQEKQKIVASVYTEDWLKKTRADQAIILYRQSLNRLIANEQFTSFSEKDLREVEKSLKNFAHGKWVYFEDYIKGCLAAVGSVLPTSLVNRGKRWKYSTPNYNEDERQFIKLITCEYLMQAGMVATGYHQDKLCLCLTPFGRLSLG
ncbi:hypothetical protein [Neochlamydia sp. S13]|jgi:hypothetical protein|uniref:hypothetical protein n=1 Tax=Neochlamydia sp. S13 TaxID=1353976 RepID=UPI0005A7A6EB|nr:hypothetical protein [Neochlamydia sp. S13]BBI16759.1 Putative uncharacterized protein [Neochlamydia sp. S13]